MTYVNYWWKHETFISFSTRQIRILYFYRNSNLQETPLAIALMNPAQRLYLNGCLKSGLGAMPQCLPFKIIIILFYSPTDLTIWNYITGFTRVIEIWEFIQRCVRKDVKTQKAVCCRRTYIYIYIHEVSFSGCFLN